MGVKTFDVKGGDKLARALNQLAAKLGNGETGVKVGFLEGATYPGTEENPGLPVATVAFWNNYGTSKAPPRPFFSQAIEKNQSEWGNQLMAALKVANYDGRRALAIMGETIKGQVVQSIVELTDPPLAPSTIKRKGFAKPLVDTGVMQRAVDYVVE